MAKFVKLYSILLLLTKVESATGSDVKSFLRELFTTKAYKNLVRSIVNQTEPVAAYVEYFLYGINDVNQVEQTLTTTGYLQIAWDDEFLKWNPLMYGGLQYLFVQQDKIWKPDISLQNGFKTLELGSKFIQVNIDSSGTIL